MSVSIKAIKAYLALYIKSIYEAIPLELYAVLFGVFFVVALLLVSIKGFKNSIRLILQVLFVEVVVLLYCFTVFCRASIDEYRYRLIPFWRFRVNSTDLQHSLLVENMLNVLMFVPLGLLIGCAFKGIGWKRMLLVSLSISVSIEILQYILRKGFAETDDVIHNVVGCAVGYGIYCLFAWIWRKMPCVREKM